MHEKQIILDTLNAFRNKDKFSTSAWKERGLNPSDSDMCDALQNLFNACADNLIAAANSDVKPKQLKSILKRWLDSINRSDYDTEERAFICDYFDQLSKIVSVDFKDNLNSWLYGKVLSTLFKVNFKNSTFNRHIKKLLLVFLLKFLFINSTFSQGNVKQRYDSLWTFYPFTIDILVGACTPLGRLSEHYRAAPQFGAGFGLGGPKLRIHYLIMPRVLNQRNSMLLNVKDSTFEYSNNTLGASIGGWATYSFYQNKALRAEIVSGVTWESIQTDIIKENKKDSISISGVGLSIGLHSWFTTFKNLNFGLRAVYTYATYNNSKYLARPIGGHSCTLSLVYRWPQRSEKYKRYRNENNVR